MPGRRPSAGGAAIVPAPLPGMADGTAGEAPADWAPAPAPGAVASRAADVRRRIAAAGGDPDAVRLVAVTKGFGPAAVLAAVAAGITDVGENYAAELRAKAAGLAAGGAPVGATAGGAPAGATAGGAPVGSMAGGAPVGATAGVRWHYLGAVQRRSVRSIAGLVALWHGLCRVEEGEAIAAASPGAPVLVQVELTGLPGRRGVAPGEVPGLVDGLRGTGVRPVGVMAIGVPGDPEATRRVFGEAAAVARGCGLAELSIGMSDDLELAVAAGATMVRVGRAIFGDRPPRRPPGGLPAK